MIKRSLLLLVAVISVLSLNAQIINLNPDPDGAAWIAGDLPEITPEIQAELEFNPPQNLAVGQQYIYPDNYYYLSWDPPIANEDAGLVGYNVYANEEIIITTSSEVLSHTTTADGLYTMGAELSGPNPEDVRFYADNANPHPDYAVDHYIITGVPNPDWYIFTTDIATVPFIGCIMHDISTGINNISKTKNINIYPNPTNSIINITNAQNSTIYVYNLLGEIVTSIDNADKFNTIDMSPYAQGTYIVKIINNTDIITKKINLVK